MANLTSQQRAGIQAAQKRVALIREFASVAQEAKRLLHKAYGELGQEEGSAYAKYLKQARKYEKRSDKWMKRLLNDVKVVETFLRSVKSIGGRELSMRPRRTRSTRASQRQRAYKARDKISSDLDWSISRIEQGIGRLQSVAAHLKRIDPRGLGGIIRDAIDKIEEGQEGLWEVQDEYDPELYEE